MWGEGEENVIGTRHTNASCESVPRNPSSWELCDCTPVGAGDASGCFCLLLFPATGVPAFGEPQDILKVLPPAPCLRPDTTLALPWFALSIWLTASGSGQGAADTVNWDQLGRN